MKCVRLLTVFPLLVFLFIAKSSYSQCNLTIGANDTLVCGDRVSLILEANWNLIPTGTTQHLNATDFVNATTGYVCGDSGKIMKSVNGGLSFVLQSTPYPANLYDIHFYSADTGFAVGQMGLLFRTVNGGATWDTSLTGVTSTLYSLQLYDAQTIFIGGENGTLLRSVNRGQTWTTIPSPTTGTIHNIHFINPNTACVAASNGLFRTATGGLNWTTNYTGFTFHDLEFLNPDTGFATGSAGINFILRTTDGGQTWNQVLGSQTWQLFHLAKDNEGTIYAMGNGFKKSRNLGEYWYDIESAPESDFTLNILRFKGAAFENSNKGIVVGTRGTLYLNSLIDSVRWSPSTGMNDSTSAHPIFTPTESLTYTVTAKVNACIDTQYYTVYVEPLKLNSTSDFFVSCGDSVVLDVQTNIQHTAGVSYQWTPALYLNNTQIAQPVATVQTSMRYTVKASTANGCMDSLTIPVDLDFKFSTQKPNLLRCGEGTILKLDTIHWQSSRPLPDANFTDIQFTGIDTAYACGGNGVFKTTDGGKTWSQNLLTTPMFVYELYFVNNQVGYVAAFNDGPMRGVILKTINGGLSWTIQDPITSYLHLIRDVFFINEQIGFAISNSNTGNKILKTINGGQGWIAYNTNTTNGMNQVYFTNSTTGYALGDNNTLIKTTNGGTVWTVLSHSMNTPGLKTMYFQNADTGFVAGSESVWKTANGGQTWNEHKIDQNIYINFTIEHIEFGANGLGYLATSYRYNPGSQIVQTGAIFLSKDGGTTWTKTNSDTLQDLRSVSTFGNKVIVCGTHGSILRNLNSPTSYVWSPALGLDQTMVAQPYAHPVQSSWYTVTGSRGNCFIRDSVNVTVVPLQIDAGATTQITCGDSVRLLPNTLYMDIDASRQGFASWTIEDTNHTIVMQSKPDLHVVGYFNLPKGKYTFKCRPQILPPPLSIRILPLHGDSISETIYMTFDTLIVREFTVPDYQNYAFNWTPQQERIGPASLATYFKLHLITSQGCEATDSVLIVPKPLMIYAGTDKSLTCGASVQLDTILTNLKSISTARIHWNNGTIMNDSTSVSPMASPVTFTESIVTVSTTNGCVTSDTVLFNVVPLFVNGMDTTLYCNDTTRLRLETNYDGNNPLQLLWSPSTHMDSVTSATPRVVAKENMKYNLRATTWNGCMANDSVSVNLKRPPAVGICLVGVNEDNKNQVVWNKSGGRYPTVFQIQRETNITNQYEIIGTRNTGDQYVFVDNTSNPFVQSNRYKLTYTDQCEMPSLESDLHQTMHLSINKGTGNTWNLSWNSYQGFTVTTYNVYRGSTINNLQLIGTSSGSNNSYSDVDAPGGGIVYQVELISPNSCNPGKNFNSSRSNKASNNPLGIDHTVLQNNELRLYPNPAQHSISVVSESIPFSDAQLTVTDILGRIVYESRLPNNRDKHEIHIDSFMNGTYLIFIENSGRIYRGKFVKQ